MSVECSSPPSTPKAGASGETGHVKGRVRTGAAAEVPDAGGFSALLTMMGSGDAGGDVHSDPSAVAPLPQEHDTPVDPGLLLAQAVQLLSAQSPDGQVAKVVAPNATEADVKAVAQDPKYRAPVELKTGVKSGEDATPGQPLADKGRERPTLQPEMNADAAKDALNDALNDAPSARHGALKSHWVDGGGQSGKERMAADEHAKTLARTEDMFSKSAVLPQLSVAAGTGESGLKQGERMKERLALKQVGGSEGGAWGHEALVQAGRIDAPSAPTETSALSPEMAVAEQVTYWISRDVQNAELKLDGMGDSAIKVSISLSGNEARVDFRTDQAQAREVLQGAVAHLKDLLGNEGLVLSSVSVGTSGSGSADPRQDRPPTRSRQALVALPEAQGTDTSMRPARLSGRTVDLFV